MNTPPTDREGHAHPTEGSAVPEEQLSLALPGGMGEAPREGDAPAPAMNAEARDDAFDAADAGLPPSATSDAAEMAAVLEQAEAPIDTVPETVVVADDLAGALAEPVLVSEMPEFVSAPAVTVTEGASLGTRLKRARELQNLTLEEVGKRLRIPAARLAELEADAYDRIAAPIYVRGYLRSYARLLGLPDIVVTAALQDVQVAPPALVATQTVSRSRYLASRYGNPLVYAVVTAVVVVPILFAAQQGSFMPRAKPRIEPLDANSAELGRLPAPAPVQTAPATDADATLVGPPVAEVQPAPAATAPVEERRPVMAAMTPMPSASYEPAAPKQQVTLSLTEPSWIELIGADGTRHEYATLPAGTTRSYALDGAAQLRIGNTRGASLSVGGKSIDLVPYTRSNVARIRLGDAAAPAAQ